MDRRILFLLSLGATLMLLSGNPAVAVDRAHGSSLSENVPVVVETVGFSIHVGGAGSGGYLVADDRFRSVRGRGRSSDDGIRSGSDDRFVRGGDRGRSFDDRNRFNNDDRFRRDRDRDRRDFKGNTSNPFNFLQRPENKNSNLRMYPEFREKWKR